MSILFSKTVLGLQTLQNHLVMAPMTRSRATDNIPGALMVEYYAQRATAGLIITEGTSPSPNGLGYPRIPGIFSPAQVEGWKRITDAVHAKGAKMFVQIMHCGRIVHPLNLPAGARLLAPSAVAADGEMYTDAEGMKPHPVPQAMTEADIKATINEFVQAAKNAVAAGFDGIELHSANGYLLEQFIRPNTNLRTDGYGGSIGSPGNAYIYNWNMLPIGQLLWEKELMSYKEFPAMQAPETYNLDGILKAMQQSRQGHD